MEGDIGYNERQRFVSSEKDPLCVSSVTKFVVKTYRGTLPRRIVLIEATISSTTVLLLSFLTNRCQRTEGNFIYSRGEKSYLLSIVLRSTSRLE